MEPLSGQMASGLEVVRSKMLTADIRSCHMACICTKDTPMLISQLRDSGASRFNRLTPSTRGEQRFDSLRLLLTTMTVLLQARVI